MSHLLPSTPFFAHKLHRCCFSSPLSLSQALRILELKR
ncbi:hypothetical protein CsSME_00025816 [Camellia sinensis var. sinensis]